MTPGTRSYISDTTAQPLSRVQQAQPAAVVEVPERPALAPDVQLLGEMQGSGFQDRQWLVLRGSLFIQLTELLYRVAEQIDGERTLEEIAARVTKATNTIVSADHVRRLIQTKLMPLLLVATAHGQSPGTVAGESRARGSVGVNMRRKVIGPRIIDPITKVLQVLFLPPVLISVLLAIAVAHWWLYALHGASGSLYAAFHAPGLLLAALAGLAVSGVFHELGHAAALRYGGGKARAISVRFYLLYPAFYTDTTASYQLGRWGRVRTELGGFYFHLIFALGIMVLYFLWRQEFLLLIVVLIDLNIIDQCLPFVRFDGYWSLVDRTGLPDFCALMGPFLRSIQPWRGGKDSDGRLPHLKTWVKTVFAVYIVVTIPLLLVLLVLLARSLPHVVPILWDSFIKQAAAFRRAESVRDYLGMARSIAMMLLLEMQAAGLLVLFYTLGRGPAWGLVRAVWNGSMRLKRRIAGPPAAAGSAVAGSVGRSAGGAASVPVRLAVTPAAAHVARSGRLSLSLTLEATTDADVRCRLEVSGMPATWYDLPRQHVILRRGETVRVPLIVHPPGHATTETGSYHLTITATLESAPGEPVSTVATVTVDAARGLSMDVMPAEVEGPAAHLVVAFVNQMDWPVAVRLAVRADQPGITFRTEPASSVVVQPGAGGGVIVRAGPTLRTRIGKARTFDVELRGVHVGEKEGVDPLLVRRARFTYVPRRPAVARLRRLRGVPAWAWAVPLALLLPLPAVLAGPMPATVATNQPSTPIHARRYSPPIHSAARGVASPVATAKGHAVLPSAPSIRRFTLVQGHQGQPYDLVWQTSNAQHVTLDGRPVSARGTIVLHAPLHSAAYGLAATSGARRATASLHIVVDASTTDRRAFVLRTPDIAIFAVRRHQGQLYAIWLVHHAVHVQLQGQPVAPAGQRLVPPGASTLRLMASNDVGSRQSLLHLAASMATPMLSPTRTPTPRPTATSTTRPTSTPTLQATATLTLRATTTSTPRPTGTPTPDVTMGATRPPTVTPLLIVTAGTATPTAAPSRPAVLLNPYAVDFGEARISTTSVVQAVYVDVVNVGGAPLTITSIAVTGTDQGDFAETDSCAGTSIGVTGRCVIGVRFTPLTTGARRATLVITDNAPGSPQTIQLTGHGLR